MELSALTAISPVDGRYQNKTDALRPIFSEYGLFRYRVLVEVEWLKKLSKNSSIKEIESFSASSTSLLNNIKDNFSIVDAERIKEIEKTTNHDMKAVEYFIREKIQSDSKLKNISQFIHFACTSEDINNLSYALMLKDARESILVPKLQKLVTILEKMSADYSSTPMISRTHGQTASPTTLGKEMAVYVHRLNRQNNQLKNIELLGKLNGAVGNFNAHFSAYPDIDWMTLSKEFVEELGLTWNPLTTQIESHDYMAQYFHVLIRSNTILIDLCRDLWGYISLGYFKLKLIKGEVGSSTMPHKINPIDFENSEGNFGFANSLLEHLAMKLPTSRWQRDLTDSTVLRNTGVGIAHSVIALDSCIAGLSKIDVDTEIINQDLENSWEVLTEAIQTVMRCYNIEGAYEKLKEISRGNEINRETLHNFIEKLDIPNDAKSRLKNLTPSNYLGNAETQTKLIKKK
ncbi:MAG TPA: adenylosuccinate lyase [Gammaproteobacteria bacterium]|nr:adenylosuccinate lyase [Gammaproteobacteria bacterium]|tara:strand:+ start:2043 stop:3419 length:1377 start_codon:yes stop_codon:yes gene_type:complete